MNASAVQSSDVNGNDILEKSGLGQPICPPKTSASGFSENLPVHSKVFSALSTQVWELVLFQSFGLLADSNDEPLAATVDFIFKAAVYCQHFPQAVRAVRVRLKNLDIDNDDFGDDCSATPCGMYLIGESETYERMHAVNQQACHTNHCVSDIYILIEMLSIPCLTIEASQTFERTVARGAIVSQSIDMVLERHLLR
ncbi:hypothetical protein ACH5RR_040071 [Cinchona calisaya]|uniref:Uncharacterized protein n=1 Tax=Cinchona calisaya TaxID=153742 RepID=A0ABD2XRG6_9GENT